MAHRFRVRIPFVGEHPSAKIERKSPLGHALAGTLNPYDYRRLVEDWNRRSLPLTVLKPQRMAGAVWMDRFVSSRRAVNLCDDCGRRYGNWWERASYQKRHQKALTDCDGCGSQLSLCTGFYSVIQESAPESPSRQSLAI